MSGDLGEQAAQFTLKLLASTLLLIQECTSSLEDISQNVCLKATSDRQLKGRRRYTTGAEGWSKHSRSGTTNHRRSLLEFLKFKIYMGVWSGADALPVYSAAAN